MNKKEIGTIFEAHRKEAGLRHLDITEMFGVGTHAITRVSNGKGYTIDTLLDLLDIVGLELVVVKKS